MPDEDPLDALTTLMERLGELADSLGLKLETFFILPTPKGQAHMAQAILYLDPEKVFKSPEERAEADTLRQMDLHMRRDTVQENIEKARREAMESYAQQMGTTADGLGFDVEAEARVKPEDAELIECPRCHGSLTTSPVSNRVDHLFCVACSWPFDKPEPATPEEVFEEPVAELEDETDASSLAARPPVTVGDFQDIPEPAEPNLDELSVEEMLRMMEDREKNGGDDSPPLAGV